MQINTANIEIIRERGKLICASVQMPVWDKENENDNFISIKIPFFGLKTFANDFSNSGKAVEEAITLFCMSAEKFGKGLETELKFLGWSFVKQTQTKTTMKFSIADRNVVVNQLVTTGDQFAHKFDF